MAPPRSKLSIDNHSITADWGGLIENDSIPADVTPTTFSLACGRSAGSLKWRRLVLLHTSRTHPKCPISSQVLARASSSVAALGGQSYPSGSVGVDQAAAVFSIVRASQFQGRSSYRTEMIDDACNHIGEASPGAHIVRAITFDRGRVARIRRTILSACVFFGSRCPSGPFVRR